MATGTLKPTSALPSICQQLVDVGGCRNYIIRRQGLIEKPADQRLRYNLATDDPEHPKDPDKSYGRATKLRKMAMKVLAASEEACTDYERFVEQFAAMDGEFRKEEVRVAAWNSKMLEMDRQHLESLDRERKNLEKELESLAAQLPVAEWWCSHPGLNLGGLAKIIAETGNLSNYENPDKVKSMLGLQVYKDKAPSTWKRKGGLSKDDWQEKPGPGYKPLRLSVVWQVVDSALKIKGGKSKWCEMYHQRKAKEIEKAEARGQTVVTTTAGTVESWKRMGLKPPTKVMDVREDKGQMSVKHLDNRARRYVMQQLIIELWARWNGEWEE